MMTMIHETVKQIKAEHPLIHCISNIVTSNDCANLALAIGASPIMAQAKEEMFEITALADALVLNTGTPSEEKYLACENAFSTAVKKGIPVVLDPVGAGASSWRLSHVKKLLSIASPDIFRVNYSEAAVLLDHSSKHTEHGVDTHPTSDLQEKIRCSMELAKAYNCVVLLSGPVDLVADKDHYQIIDGGSDLSRQITGAGCMLSVLTGVFSSVIKNPYMAAVLASQTWKKCAEEAEKNTKGKGLGTYHVELFNAISTL